MEKVKDFSCQSCVDDFFKSQSNQVIKKPNHLQNSLVNETGNQCTINLEKRKIFEADNFNKLSVNLKQHIIILPWGNILALPVINQVLYQDYIANLEDYLQSIEFLQDFNNQTLKDSSHSLQNFFNIIQHKINFYFDRDNNNHTDIIALITKTISFLEEIKSVTLTQFINHKAILIYACPEIADADILDFFLKINNKHEKFNTQTIYQHLTASVFENKENFYSSLNVKTNFEARYTFGLPKLAAFFLAINYNIKTDKHPTEKTIRRFDEFIQKSSDFFLHANQVMYDKNIVFSDLSEFNKKQIIQSVSKLTMILAENGLLLEKAHFSYLLYTFDSILGGFFNNLNEIVYFDSQYLNKNRKEEKRHLLLVADKVINSLYDLPEMLNIIIKNLKLNIDDKKLIISNIMQRLQQQIADKIIDHLDECIIDLDHNFICNKLMALPFDEAENKAKKWRDIAEISLKNLDNNISKKDDFMNQFNKKIVIRKVILKGFTEIISALYQNLGDKDHFLYDYSVAGIMHKVSVELNKEQSSKSTGLTAEILDTVFKRTRHFIGEYIEKAQDEFSKSLLKSCQVYSKRAAVDRAKNKSLGSNNKQIKNNDIPLIDRVKYATTETLENKNTFEQMEETKQLFATMLCAYSDSPETNKSHLSLIEHLNSNKNKKSQGYKIHTTNIHQLTSEEIFSKIYGGKTIVSIKQSFYPVADSIFRPSISRSETTLAPAENIRKKNYIIMEEKDHETLKNLCQYALQKIKLQMKNLSFNNNNLKDLCVYLNRQIKNVDKINETRIIDPFKWLINALNTVYQSSDAILKLKDDLQEHFNMLSCNYNKFLKNNYNKQCITSWDNHLKEYLHASDKTFAQIITNSNIPIDQKQFIIYLFASYDDCFTDIFQSNLSQKLPPSLETVIIYQKIMAFHLGSDVIKNKSRQIDIDKFYNSFRIGIIYYNDHLESLVEQMAFKLYSEPDRHAGKLQQLEQTSKKVYQILQSKAISQMMQGFEYLSSSEDTQELIQQFNQHLDQIFKLQFFEKYFGKQSSIFKFLGEIVGYCSKNSAFIPGAFVAAAVVNIFFTAPGTSLLRDLQKSAPALFNAIVAMQQIFLQMQTIVPGLEESAAILYAVPLNGTENISSCAADIYKNMGISENISFTDAVGSAEDGAVSLLQSLYYKDNQGCPSGGLDSFPPNSFVNWPNALTTVVSISSGAIACFSGWAKDVDAYVKGVKEYSSLSNIFQDFSPDITEKLLLESVRNFPSRKDNAKTVYPGATTVNDFCLDALDTIFNKTIKYTSKISPQYALNWSLWILRYLTCGSCSMAIVKRPHSLEEIRDRVCIAASDRKFKTLIRMLGYNSAKEFIDVFSTKSGTLAFLLFLKEADFFEAINEKAGIADYQVMKAKHDKFLSCMDSLSKNSRVLDVYQVAMLKEVYGVELIDNLLGANAKIIGIEKSVQTKINAMLHRIAGVFSLGLIYVAQCANLYSYTLTPWLIAKQALDKLQGKSVSLSDPVFERIRDASKKTISREFNPSNLSYEQTFWHYIFAERASTKFQQSFLLWGIKETINLSMYLNATAHERSMGINTVNWELLGCLLAYLLKDSTGMCARFATLLDDESLRTFFSLLDKLDSPLAEKVLSEIGRFGLNPPQSIINVIKSMMEEVIITSTGDAADIHRKANKKYQELERIGISTFKNVAQIQEKEIERIMELMLSTIVQNFSSAQGDITVKQEAKQLPAYYQQLASQLRQNLQHKMVAHGMPVDAKIQKEVDIIDEFMQSNAYGFNSNNPLELIDVFAKLQEKISKIAVGAWSYQKIISQVRSLQPQDKTKMRLKSLQEDINQRNAQTGFLSNEDELLEVVVQQPSTMQVSDSGKLFDLYV